MKINKLIYCFASLSACLCLCACHQKEYPSEGAFLRQLQPGDSVLIADQLEYGFFLPGIGESDQLVVPEDIDLPENVTLVSKFRLDTLKVTSGNPASYDVEGKMLITSFDEGEYELPSLKAVIVKDGGRQCDTILFDALTLEVHTMPIDTATFVMHDIKGQFEYPLTMSEILAPVLIILGILALIAGVILMVRDLRRKRDPESESKDPSYIVALRQLEQYRGEQFWEGDKQKTYYSGITDTLRVYISDRFEIGATEMTTAEVFDALKGSDAITPEVFESTRNLFELADFVKFAKHTASREESAAALSTAVRFVTSTIAESPSGEGDANQGGE